MTCRDNRTTAHSPTKVNTAFHFMLTVFISVETVCQIEEILSVVTKLPTGEVTDEFAGSFTPFDTLATVECQTSAKLLASTVENRVSDDHFHCMLTIYTHLYCHDQTLHQ